jgi:putative sterol carrier protein
LLQVSPRIRYVKTISDEARKEQFTAAPVSARQSFEMMPSRFNMEAAKGLTAVYEFDLKGEDGGKWQVSIRDQKIEIKEGSAANADPNITIAMEAQDYLDMLSGKLNGQIAFMSGKLRISGDMGLALRMQNLFNV